MRWPWVRAESHVELSGWAAKAPEVRPGPKVRDEKTLGPNPCNSTDLSSIIYLYTLPYTFLDFLYLDHHQLKSTKSNHWSLNYPHNLYCSSSSSENLSSSHLHFDHYQIRSIKIIKNRIIWCYISNRSIQITSFTRSFISSSFLHLFLLVDEEYLSIWIEKYINSTSWYPRSKFIL